MTLIQIRVDTASGETEIDFPHAWSGPYFVKVLYLGSEGNKPVMRKMMRHIQSGIKELTFRL